MKKELVTQRNPKSPITEMFKTLRTNVQFMNSQKNLKTILVTSTVPGEGKSWIASNLAITFAQTGKKVALIDADMRKGRLDKLFQIPNKPGLSNLLSGIDERGTNQDIHITKYIKSTEVENLFVIPSGNIPPNPAELLGTEKTIKIIEELKSIFDIIILDGTPCLLVTDSVILSRMVDTTILVTSHKVTKKEDLQKVKKLIENVGGNIAGVILNKVPINTKKYSTSYYYGNKSNSTSKKPQKHKEDRNNAEDEGNEISDKEKENILSQIDSYLKDKE